MDSVGKRGHDGKRPTHWSVDDRDGWPAQVEDACRRGDRTAIWALTETYLDAHRDRQRPLSPHTARAYRQSIDLLLSRWPAEMVLHPSEDAVAALMDDLRQSGASASTVKVRLAGLRALYRALRWAGAVERDPFADMHLDVPRDRMRPERTPYSDEERNALLRVAQPVDRVLILLLAAGLRVSECVDLRWPSVVLEARCLRIPGRGGRPERMIPFTRNLLDGLRQLPGGSENRILSFSTDVRARQRIQRLCVQAQVPYRGVHALKPERLRGKNRYAGRFRDGISVTRDETTIGLPGRSAFDEELRRAMAAAERTNNDFALMVVHLAGLSRISDTHGREIAEATLRALASRIDRTRRAYDFVAYLPQDTFHIILKHVESDEDLIRIADRLRGVISTHPIRVQDKELTIAVTVNASMGVRKSPELPGERGIPLGESAQA